MLDCFFVGAGGFLGAIARYIVAVWVSQRWGRSFPFGTFFINISGSFLIGLFMSVLTERLMVNPQWRLFLVVGFLGAYTTFSTFQYETGNLLKDGEWIIATVNVLLSIIVGFTALKLGELLAKVI